MLDALLWAITVYNKAINMLCNVLLVIWYWCDLPYSLLFCSTSITYQHTAANSENDIMKYKQVWSALYTWQKMKWGKQYFRIGLSILLETLTRNVFVHWLLIIQTLHDINYILSTIFSKLLGCFSTIRLESTIKYFWTVSWLIFILNKNREKACHLTAWKNYTVE